MPENNRLAYLLYVVCFFQQLKTASVVGRFDAVVVHADNSAVPFFRKCGFSDDVILNKRWRLLS